MDDGQLPDTSDKDRRNVLFDFFATQPDNKDESFGVILKKNGPKALFLQVLALC
jgi:hypothetical protein